MLVQPIEKSAGSQSLTGPTNGRVAGYDLPGGLRVIAVDGMGSISAHRGDKLLPPPIVKVALPLDWRKGEKVIVPPPKTADEMSERVKDNTLEKVDFYLAKKDLKY